MAAKIRKAQYPNFGGSIPKIVLIVLHTELNSVQNFMKSVNKIRKILRKKGRMTESASVL